MNWSAARGEPQTSWTRARPMVVPGPSSSSRPEVWGVSQEATPDFKDNFTISYILDKDKISTDASTLPRRPTGPFAFPVSANGRPPVAGQSHLTQNFLGAAQ